MAAVGNALSLRHQACAALKDETWKDFEWSGFNKSDTFSVDLYLFVGSENSYRKRTESNWLI